LLKNYYDKVLPLSLCYFQKLLEAHEGKNKDTEIENRRTMSWHA